MNEAVFQATFVDVRPAKRRGVYQFIFEVAEEMSDAALQAIGGLPRASESRFVAIARLDQRGIKEWTAEEEPLAASSPTENADA